jgi:hypothetical protein
MTVESAMKAELVRQLGLKEEPQTLTVRAIFKDGGVKLVEVDMGRLAKAAMDAMPAAGKRILINLDINPDGSLSSYRSF